MSEPLVVILAVAGVVLTGRSLLALVDRICVTLAVSRTVPEVWGTSILLGISFTAAAGFVWSDIGRPLTSAFAWKQLLLGSSLGILATVQSIRRRTSTPAERTRPGSFLARFFPVALAVVLGGGFLVSFVPPPGLNDPDLDAPKVHPDRIEMSRRARELFRQGTIDAKELFPVPGYPYHFRQPLLLPLAERHVHALIGHPSESSTSIWSPLCLAGLALCYAGVLARRTSTAWGWMLATGLAVMPMFWTPESGLPAKVADLPITGFLGVCVLYLWDALHEAPGRVRVRAILLASGMASSAVFTKSEGLSYLMAMIPAWLLASVGQQNVVQSNDQVETNSSYWRRGVLALAIFILFAAFLLTPWMLYRASMPINPQSVRYERLASGPLILRIRHPELLQACWDLVTRHWWKAGLPAGLMIVAMISAPRRSWLAPQRFILLNIAFAYLILEFLLAPAGLMAQLGGSAEPLLLHQLPNQMLLVAAVWSNQQPSSKGEIAIDRPA